MAPLLEKMANIERNPNSRPNEADIRAALSRIVLSPCLNKSPQLANFLTFVVDETLAGRGERIKAYNIAADAFGRNADFDPQSDPIVRVEAGRLRRAIEHYYANGGGKDPIIIDLPRGHYMPVFRSNAQRRRIAGHVQALWRRSSAFALENIRLIVLIAVVAAVVSLAIDLLGRLF